ncbi:hypothetical protein PROFUN_03081 [Planoprotostelium fungivorum]|uniref:THH1/TOM1/TOM3 domain-containing protein n=1 Tax=Planoprotostelium fungivorum TaxID=1890364 RepID=A0A2P6NQ56_9EUKA|nr:hypothetical protein PROFUN_03081 [Planoprotostelium fungivorum]
MASKHHAVWISLLLLGIYQSTLAQHCTDCQGRGKCQDDGTCRCFGAYDYPTSENGTLLTDSCGHSALLENERGVKAMRIITAILSSVLIFLICSRLFLEIRFASPTVVAGQTNIRRVVQFSLSVNLFICLFMFLLSALDWWGTYNIMPFHFYNAIWMLIDWLFIVLFTGLLLHWAELYQKTMKSIKQRDMMMKVNSNYQGELTVEQVMTKLTFLQRFKIPFILVTVISGSVWVGRIVGNYKIWTVSAWRTFYPFEWSFFSTVWLLFGIIFTVYGIRLCRVMPEMMAHKMKMMTFKMIAVLMLQILAALHTVISNVVEHDTSKTIMRRDAITWTVRLLVCFIILEIHMPLTKIRYWFSSKLLHSSTTARSGSGKTGSAGSRTEIDLVPVSSTICCAGSLMSKLAHLRWTGPLLSSHAKSEGEDAYGGPVVLFGSVSGRTLLIFSVLLCVLLRMAS